MVTKRALYIWFHIEILSSPVPLKKTKCQVSNINDLVVKALDSQSRDPMFKPSWWLQGRLSFSSFEVDQMSIRNFWKLRGKKVNCLLVVAL